MNRQAIRSAGAVALCAGLGMSISASAQQVTANWLNAVSGNWTDATRWSTPQIPNNVVPGGTTYHAVIDAVGAPYTVTLNGAATLDRFTLSSADATLRLVSGQLSFWQPSVVQEGTLRVEGGSVTGSGDLTIHSSLIWTGGLMASTPVGSGKLTLTENCHTVIQRIGGTPTLSRTTENFGSVDWSGSAFSLGAAFDNYGQISSQGTMAVSATGPSSNVMRNHGLFVKGGVGEQSFGNARLLNSGEVRVEGGALSLRAGGDHTGSFEIGAGATLRFEGVQNLEAGSSIAGDGTLVIGGGTFQSAGLTSVRALSMLSGTASFSGGLAASELSATGGTLNLPNALDLSSFVLTDNRLRGGVQVRLLEGGTGLIHQVSGGGSFVASMSVNLVNEGALQITRVRLEGGSIRNEGTLWFNSGGIMQAQGSGGALENNGTFNVQAGTGQAEYFADLGTFVNRGLVQVANGRFYMHAGLENSGTVRVSAGATLRLGANTIVSKKGAFDIDGVVEFTGGIHDLNPSRWDVGGVLRVMGGEVTLYEAPSGSLDLHSGTVNYEYHQSGGATFTSAARQNFNGGYTVNGASALLVTNGGGVGFGPTDQSFATGDVNGALGGSGVITFTDSFLWRGGVMDGAGVTIVGEDAAMTTSGSAAKSLRRTLDVRSDVNWGAPSLNIIGGTFINRGAFRSSIDVSSSASSGGTFVNEGVIEVLGGTFTLGGLVNRGDVHVSAGSTFGLRTLSSLVSILTKREYAATIINSMMAMITAKLAKMRWRHVQFFTVDPRVPFK